jgi:DNA-directed RNA polymerase II subunit RPB7
MFYLTNLSKELGLFPKDLGLDSESLIKKKIRELEGKVIGTSGYIISIVDFNQKTKGQIDNETGRVNFKVDYRAITFKPIEGEIIDSFPVVINEHGFFCKVGPLQIFVSQYMMGDSWEYNTDENAWERNDQIIRVDEKVNLRILAVRINSDEITALGELTEF